MLGGVCGGLGAYFDVNPALYRVGFVLLALLGGAGVVIYGACLLVIPNEGEDESIATEALRNHRRRPAMLIGLVLVGVAGIALLSHITFRVGNELLWLVALGVGAAILLSERRRSRPHEVPPATPTDDAAPAAAVPGPPAVAPREPERGPSPFLIALGALVVAGGILGVLAATGVDVPWAIALGAAAVAVGIGVVAGAVNRRRVGALEFLGILLAFAAILAGTIHLHLDDGIGNRSYAPTATSDVQRDYRLGLGHLRVDLTHLAVEPGPTRVQAHLGAGDLEIVVPRGVLVRVVGHADWGDVNILGRTDNGHDVTTTVGPSDARLAVDAHVGAGKIEVTRAVR
jgi:phage shock protein PspC (stress-responsive transcriptional regulator)